MIFILKKINVTLYRFHVINCNMGYIGYELCCSTPLSIIFQIYRGCQPTWWRKPDYAGKTTDLPEVIEAFIT